MEYLYSQTGKTLTPVLQNPEEEVRLVEEVDDQDLQDEGVQSPALLVEPSSLSGGEGQHLVPANLLLSQPSDTGSSLSNKAQGAGIGPDGITGWDKVRDLGGYMVGLHEAPYLTDLQVTEAIQLWTAFPDFDKSGSTISLDIRLS
ncbi:hypothetical protein M9458_053382 [Cirrhinus mrigala]|uniref:Uncharacterized protein n=1 Tax=Cirrhinus mrigala TaxID=683832 RepID=A0ABD0MRI1_CIRMR